MITRYTTLRVRYSETDQMGYVYYGNYPAYFEVGRAEMVRDLGVPYSVIEREMGLMMPVLEMHVQYIQPARYDDVITLQTQIPVVPTLKWTFLHVLTNDAGKILVKGETRLVLVDAKTMKPVRTPDNVLAAIHQHWNT